MKVYVKQINGKDHWRATVSVQVGIADRGFLHHIPKRCDKISYEDYLAEAMVALGKIKKQIEAAEDKTALIKKHKVKLPKAD